MKWSATRGVRMAPGIVVAAAFALTAGCSGPAPAPVAIPSIALDRTTVPLGATIEATIRFVVSPELGGLTEGYQVVLHVLDDDGEELWSEPHDPPVPPSEWEPGDSIEYTRRVRIPPYPYLGPAVIAIGLHSPAADVRLALAGDDLGNFTYRVASIELTPQHESSFVTWEEGWRPTEFDYFDRTQWRWTTGRAVLSFRNPQRATRLSLEVQGRADLSGSPQVLSLAVGERTLLERTFDTNAAIRIDHELTAADLGDDDVVRLALLVDRTFVPAEIDEDAADTRTLGVRVFDVYVEPLAESAP